MEEIITEAVRRGVRDAILEVLSDTRFGYNPARDDILRAIANGCREAMEGHLEQNGTGT